MRVAAKAAVRNSKTKRALREATKAFTKAVESGKPAEISKALQEVSSALDIAAKKAVIHKNKAARKKSQLTDQAKAAGGKMIKSTPKTAAKAPAKKKPAAKAKKRPAVKK